ncbi:MAG: hypothetical protein U9R04_03475 [Chloroflexota bacterium]|nr:hypothetical protein [Chloroflexota bacterium]
MEQKQSANQPEDEVKAYNILLKRHINDDRLMGERSSAFLAGSSILFVGFIMLVQFCPTSRMLCIAIPILGLLLCFCAIFSNGRTRKGLNFWMGHAREIEEKGCTFAYMKDKNMLPSSVDKHVGLFKLPNRKIYAFIVPGIFIALWGLSLWVLCLN